MRSCVDESDQLWLCSYRHVYLKIIISLANVESELSVLGFLSYLRRDSSPLLKVDRINKIFCYDTHAQLYISSGQGTADAGMSIRNCI